MFSLSLNLLPIFFISSFAPLNLHPIVCKSSYNPLHIFFRISLNPLPIFYSMCITHLPLCTHYLSWLFLNFLCSLPFIFVLIAKTTHIGNHRFWLWCMLTTLMMYCCAHSLLQIWHLQIQINPLFFGSVMISFSLARFWALSPNLCLVMSDVVLMLFKFGWSWKNYSSLSPRLRFQLQTLKIGSMSVDDYILQMHSIPDGLFDAGHSLFDEDLVLYILGGLSPKFEAVVVSFTTRGSLPSLTEVQSILHNHEMRLLQPLQLHHRNHWILMLISR